MEVALPVGSLLALFTDGLAEGRDRDVGRGPRHTGPGARRPFGVEGGRGLFIVAQFVRRWSTRYTPTGKTIWTEQALPPVVTTRQAPPPSGTT